MAHIIYQQSFYDTNHKPIGCRKVRVVRFSDGKIQFTNDDDDEPLFSCTVNNISSLAETYTEKFIDETDEKESAVEADAKCSSDFHKEEYSNGSTFCRVCGKRIRTA